MPIGAFFDSLVRKLLIPLTRASRFFPESFQNLSLPAKQMIQAAWNGIQADQLIDDHVHVIGTHKKNFIHPKFLDWKHPLLHIRYLVFQNGFKIDHFDQAEEELERDLIQLINDIPQHGKYGLLAFDKCYTKEGIVNDEQTALYVSNDYVFSLAHQYPHLFFPIMSIHPYRKDAIEALYHWANQGGKIIKWMPNAMGMNPQDEQCSLYYETMHHLGLTLLSHTGYELAVSVSRKNQKLGNPLLLRKPLEHGVKVIMAHCATCGSSLDLDHSSYRKVPSFDLFLRMMRDPQYKGLLYGDLAAVTQINRMQYLSSLLEETQPGGVLEGRLINGSDYPLPMFNFLISTKALRWTGYLTQEEQKSLNEIYHYNPLLFDFVLKRTIHHPRTQERFPPSLFLSHLEISV